MTGTDFNDLEITPPEVIKQLVHEFAEALSETPEFQAFEQAAERLYNDEAATKAREAFEAKAKSLEALQMLGAVSAQDAAELERLRQALIWLPSFTAYTQAQKRLVPVCQAAGNVLSMQLGIDFAAVCAPGCC